MTFNESKASKLTSQSKYFITELYSWVISSLANVKTCFNFLKKIYFLAKKKYLLQLLFLSSRNFSQCYLITIMFKLKELRVIMFFCV